MVLDTLMRPVDVPLGRKELGDPPESPAGSLRRVSADEFARICRQIPPEPGKRFASDGWIADLLGERLGQSVNRKAVSKWRRGVTPVHYEVVLAACALADLRWHVEFEHR